MEHKIIPLNIFLHLSEITEHSVLVMALITVRWVSGFGVPVNRL